MRKQVGRRWTPCILGLLTLSGCISAYRGPSRAFDPREFDRDTGWVAVREVRIQRQASKEDCGAASLAMILTYWGLPQELSEVKSGCPPRTGRGLTAAEMARFLESKGLKAYCVKGTLSLLESELRKQRPVIVGVVKPYLGNKSLKHFQVVVGLNPDSRTVVTLDPASGWRQSDLLGFLSEWSPSECLTIVVFRPEETR